MVGHADIVLDFNNMMEEAVGPGGLSRKELQGLEGTFRQIHSGLTDLRRLGQLPFADLPYQEEMAQKYEERARRVREEFDEILLIGIGGSSLGVACLHEALSEGRHGPRLHLCNNLDADCWLEILRSLDPQKTLVIVVSKSGKTTETLAAFLFFRDHFKKRLGELAMRRHFVVITDPHQGPLRHIVEGEKLESLPFPTGVGGRYSVLSAAGLFPAACLGIGIADLLAGARRIDDRCRNPDLWFNPAAMSAALHYLADTKKGRRLRVLMPYGERLNAFAGWFAQLWAESLGKRFSLKGKEVGVGPTPIRAVGVEDQHSQLQLYLEGPPDKTVTFFSYRRRGEGLTVPATDSSVSEFVPLGGRSVEELQTIEREATEMALTKNGRPNMTIDLRELTPFAMGQLLFMAEMETVTSGQFYNINPFDQPAVESIKKYVRGLLGDPEFGLFRRELEEARNLRSRRTYRI